MRTTATFSNDTFTDTDQALSTHTPETGGAWAANSGNSSISWVIRSNRIRPTGTGNAFTQQASATPASADYSVQADVYWAQATPAYTVGIAGRLTGTTGSNATAYILRVNTANTLVLAKFTSGTTLTTLGSTYSIPSPSIGTVHTIKLEMIGTTIKGYIDGSEVISATDSAVTATGVAALYSAGATQPADANGTHLDNFSAFDAVTVPVNTVAPVISGTPVVGYTLSTTNGTWSNSPTGYTYQWKRDGTNISGATSSTYQLTSAEVGTTVKCAVTASNGSGSGTATDSSNGLLVVSAMVANDVQWLSSATGFGGAPGNPITDPRAFFDDVLNSEAVAGDIEYRLVYLKNAHTLQELQSTVAWISSQTSSSGTDLAIGIATEAVNTNVAAVANENTAPAGVTFGAPSSSGTGFSVGTLPAGGYRGVWLKRTVTAGATATGTDSATFDWQGTPA